MSLTYDIYWDSCESHSGGTDYFVKTEREDGRRFQHYHILCSQLEVEALISRMKTVGINPVNNEHWMELDPCYGSDWHQKIGDRHLMSHEELSHNINMGYMS